MATAEESRALAYRVSQRRRAAAERTRQRQLAGSKAAYQTLYERTRPLMRYDAHGVPLITSQEEPTDGREQA